MGRSRRVGGSGATPPRDGQRPPILRAVTGRSAPPPCRSMGAHCTDLAVVLKVGDLDDGPADLDQLGTWLLGHTQRITFGRIFEEGTELLVEAVLHVACRYYERGSRGARCRAHGYAASVPRPVSPDRRDRKLGDQRFEVVTDRRLKAERLRRPARALPVVSAPEANPCHGAPCRTADHTRGAACCRDLVVAMRIPERARHREALVRSRRSPYLCKVDRTGPTTLEAEMISACSFLERDGISCALHGRVRPSGRVAKPWLCSKWPKGAEVTHPGCRLVDER